MDHLPLLVDQNRNRSGLGFIKLAHIDPGQCRGAQDLSGITDRAGNSPGKDHGPIGS
jgi:hypothetical protein